MVEVEFELDSSNPYNLSDIRYLIYNELMVISAEIKLAETKINFKYEEINKEKEKKEFLTEKAKSYKMALDKLSDR